MGNDKAAKAADDGKAGKVNSKKVGLCHFFGVAYPKTPATIAESTAR
jgi:hypothetical protein